jgi:hypothetical protein
VTACPASTNLHTLAVSLEAMQRLLGRRTADGALMLADPALIEAAIETGLAEVASVRVMLAEASQTPTSPWQGSVDNLIAAVAEVDGLLTMLKEMLSRLGD